MAISLIGRSWIQWIKYQHHPFCQYKSVWRKYHHNNWKKCSLLINPVRSDMSSNIFLAIDEYCLIIPNYNRKLLYLFAHEVLTPNFWPTKLDTTQSTFYHSTTPLKKEEKIIPQQNTIVLIHSHVSNISSSQSSMCCHFNCIWLEQINYEPNQIKEEKKSQNNSNHRVK